MSIPESNVQKLAGCKNAREPSTFSPQIANSTALLLHELLKTQSVLHFQESGIIEMQRAQCFSALL